MEVQNLLVEEISIAQGRHAGIVTSTLYQFPEPTWISPHRDREGHRLGPMSLFGDPKEAKESQDMAIRRFGERKLHVEGTRHLTISFRDRWTVPPWTAYALVLPKGMIASNITVTRHEAPQNVADLQLAASHDDHLFYHTVFGWTNDRQVFDVEGRFEEDAERYAKSLKSTEVVEAAGRFKELGKRVRGGITSPDLWFKLLELGSKFMHSP